MGAYSFSAYVEKEGGGEVEERLVYGEKFVRNHSGSKPYVHMNTDGFFVTPGYVMLDNFEPISFSSTPEETAGNYIKRGCSLLLIQHLVTSIRHYRQLYDEFLNKLSGIPVNYMVVPVINAKLIKAEMVRFFARKGCPFLCIEVDLINDLKNVSWEWLVQAQAYKRIPLTIRVKDSENTSNNYSELWSSLSKQYGIIKLSELQDDEIVSFQNLKDSGIFPSRGRFTSGGQADYNLFWKIQHSLIDEQEKFIYHNPVPNVTIMNGQVKQVNQTLVDRKPGTHIQVKLHKHFV
ncbi:hypothetical protein SAMN05216353_103125 [Halobacillus alkaliphilus]|uniref:Uncharacterized protein n=1 Tax=Halobacillus alkaliphilus TaxID=396056 RepID=A0A1I2K3K2_9BACI|nr:hypothetical protein [Halobacillus alkaliphilus]SFF61775.1 hypothetical protein SAMN05216353_103125 [Halobacillus alkaliphilus]